MSEKRGDQEKMNLEVESMYRYVYGEWIGATEEEKRQEEMARAYHSRCDLYDKQVCSGKSPRSGEPMPIDQYELAWVNRHSYQVRRELLQQYGVTEKEFHDAIVRYPDAGRESS